MPQSAWLVLARQKKDEGRQCTARSAGKFLGKARKVCPGYKKSFGNPYFLASAAQLGAVRTLKGIEVNHGGRVGITALMLACRFGYADVVRRLLAVDGIEVNKADDTGKTALMFASEDGNGDIVSRLLEVDGIDVNKADSKGLTALMYASPWTPAHDVLTRTARR